MKKKEMKATSFIDGPTFSEYAIFDVMRRQKRWVRPLLFAAIFVSLSVLAFSRQGKQEQAVLLGGVLLGVGILLPLAYLLSFFLSVRRQSRLLDPKKPAYTLLLGEEGLVVTKGKQTVEAKWESLYAAYRLRRSICLFVDAQHSFLLPRGCGEEKFALAWSLVEQHMAPEKRRVIARGKDGA